MGKVRRTSVVALQPESRKEHLWAVLCGRGKQFCHVRHDNLFRTFMPLAEIILLLVVLVMYLEVAPEDIPRRCDVSIQQDCLNEFVKNTGGTSGDGEFEVMFAERSCGTVRVQCWRSAFQSMHFDYRLNANGAAAFNASLEFCQCLLNGAKGINGRIGNDIPPENSWRTADENPYFCEDLKWLNLMAFGGLLLGIFIVLVRSYVENEDDLADVSAKIHGKPESLAEVAEDDAQAVTAKQRERNARFRRAVVVTVVLNMLWLAWSVAIGVILSGYFVHDGTDCEYPQATLLTYVGVIAWVSFACALYTLITVLLVACYDRDRMMQQRKGPSGNRVHPIAINQTVDATGRGTPNN